MAVEITMSGTRTLAEPGDEIVVRLDESAITGFVWTIMDLGRHVELVSSESIENDTRHERVIRLRAKDPGTSNVRLELRRPWEKTRIERFELQVEVRERL